MAKRRKYQFKGTILRQPVGMQNKYQEEISDLTKKMTTEICSEIIKLMKADFAQAHFQAMAGHTVGMDAASISSQMRIFINSMKKKYDQLFGKLAFNLSPWMANEVNRASSVSVKKSLKDAPNLRQEGKKLSIALDTLDLPTLNLLKASAARSSAFITSVPERFMSSIEDGVYSSIATGNGLEDLEPLLEKQTDKIANWAHNTAMDQTRKAYNGLNLGRMNKVGISRGEWIHSGGSQHPRELHEDFDGQTFDLSIGAPVGDYDGNMVLPGDEPNCRCTFAPVVEFDDDDDDEEADDSDSDVTDTMDAFNENEARDEHGRWTAGAIEAYTLAGSYPINDYLRNGTDVKKGKYADATNLRSGKDVVEAIGNLDNEFLKASLDKDTTVYRGVNDEAWEKIKENFKSTAEIVDKGYASTAKSRKNVTGSTLTHWLTISVPKGYQAIDINATGARNRTKGEILLKRGTRFKVTKMTANNATLEVIP